MENKTYVFEGKTTNEAIENGLKELKVSKNMVEIKVLEQEEKRSFFSILTPRVVKVEMTLKENYEKIEKKHKKGNEEVDQTKLEEVASKFLDEFISKFPDSELNYKIKVENNNVSIDIDGKDTGFLIGFRGETLNSLQNILSSVIGKSFDSKIKVLLNIGGYREKREKDLQILASKIANSVVKTNKSITLEPMTAYERKIIHLKLQDSDKVETHSIGEEPYRKIVVSLKK